MLLIVGLSMALGLIVKSLHINQQFHQQNILQFIMKQLQNQGFILLIFVTLIDVIAAVTLNFIMLNVTILIQSVTMQNHHLNLVLTLKKIQAYQFYHCNPRLI